jgi:hypothetical protein
VKLQSSKCEPLSEAQTRYFDVQVTKSHVVQITKLVTEVMTQVSLLMRVMHHWHFIAF